MPLDLGQGDLVKGAKMHGRRCGAHEKKRDQHLDCANLCPGEITFWSVAVGAYVRNLILRLRRRVREFRTVDTYINFVKNLNREQDTRAYRTRHTTSSSTQPHAKQQPTNARTPDKPHVHTHTHLPMENDANQQTTPPRITATLTQPPP